MGATDAEAPALTAATGDEDGGGYGADVARRVTRGGAVRAGSFVAANALTAVGSVFLLRHLGLVDFGRYGTVMALLALVSGVTDAGLTITASRELALLPVPERRRYLEDVVGLRCALSILGVAAAVGFALLAGYSRTLVLGTLLGGIGIVLVSIQAALLLPLTVELRNERIAVSETARQALQVVAIIALSVAGASLLMFLAAQIWVGAGLLALTPLLLGRGRLAAPRWRLARWRALLVTALPIAVTSVLAVVYFRILVLMTSLLANGRETGLFVTSARVFELIAGLPLLLTGIILPVLSVAARDDEGRMRYVTQRLTEVAALAGVFIALAVAIAAKPVLVILGGHQYAAAAPVLRIQALAVVTLFLIAAWNPALIALGHQRAMAITAVVGVVSAVGGGLVLIPLLHARGAAVATVVADVINAAAVLVAVRRTGLDWRIPRSFPARLAASTAAAAAVGFLVPAPALATAVAALAVFAALALALGVVPPEVRTLLRRRA